MLACCTGTAEAHRDRILHIEADGAIRDVPAAFGPVRLIIKRLGSENPLIELAIGMHHTTLPQCVARIVRSMSVKQIQVTGSWYHDETPSSPYYLNLRFFNPGYDATRSDNASQEFSFNLHNAELLGATSFEANRSGNGGQFASLKLPAGCKLDQAK